MSIRSFLLRLAGVAVVASVSAAAAREPGSTFRDCPDCPEMIVLASGTFFMGTEFDRKSTNLAMPQEVPRHRVVLARPFALGRFEVTQAEWLARMEFNPSSNKGGLLPVDMVRRHSVEEFVKRLAKHTGKPYRLPSEAEWEYAARAGTETEYWTGTDMEKLRRHDWYAGNARSRLQPVGSKPANPFGLHDMFGNVSEWVADCWLEGGTTRPRIALGHARPTGDGTPVKDCASGAFVLRGGAVDLGLQMMRSAARSRGDESYRLWPSKIGFRVALDLR
ncbi:formylglycine-generating enzyme family protein [Nostoc sp. CHAB 5714]|uniref:Formylglycine-generating enzyme family protein n=1 Tax=Nostoc favosum CHAB5714 TaxID=2780399 RepID=A0ABS8IIX3_9NOSO|nr:formylglycine-generating enzyme family protein [Nostoc favosum CHAB5714]